GLADALDEAAPGLAVRGLEGVVVALDAGPADQVRANRGGEVHGAQRDLERLAAEPVVRLREGALAEARFEVKAGGHAVDVVLAERLAHLVEVVLAEFLRIVELVAVHQIAEALDRPRDLLCGRLLHVVVVRLIAHRDEARDHRAEGPDSEACLHHCPSNSMTECFWALTRAASSTRMHARLSRGSTGAGAPSRSQATTPS